MRKFAYLVVTVSILALAAGAAVADGPAFLPVRANTLIGAKAVDPQGQSLGTISDLVIAGDNQSSYVVVAKADHTAFVTLPFTAASPQVNPDHAVVLSVSKQDFDKAPTFASKNVPELAYMPRSECKGAWEAADFNQVNGISTLNPYMF